MAGRRQETINQSELLCCFQMSCDSAFLFSNLIEKVLYRFVFELPPKKKQQHTKKTTHAQLPFLSRLCEPNRGFPKKEHNNTQAHGISIIREWATPRCPAGRTRPSSPPAGGSSTRRCMAPRLCRTPLEKESRRRSLGHGLNRSTLQGVVCCFVFFLKKKTNKKHLLFVTWKFDQPFPETRRVKSWTKDIGVLLDKSMEFSW